MSALQVRSVAPAVRRHGEEAGEITDAVVDGQRTTVGVHMVGDPWINPAGGLLGWRQAQYATAMAQRLGLIGADSSGLDARCGGVNEVVFLLAGSGVEIARFTIPDRVMTFDPFRRPLQLADQREGA